MFTFELRKIVLLITICLISLVGGSSIFHAQETQPSDEPIPLGWSRTEADIAAIEQLMQVAVQRDAYVPYGERSHVSQYVVPRTIKVGITGYLHCSDWLENDQPIEEVIEIPFIDYVKQVLPNEWRYTWDQDALMAGAMAAKTFAWWKMTLDWGRPEGADIVDNTCDQVFIRNSRRDSTDKAVDDTWNMRMSNPSNLIPEVHYLSTDEYCEQSILRPCMGQWGSQYMAEDGATWQDILHHYFDPIDINPTAEIPVKSNVIQNGKYDLGLENWQTWGDLAGLNTNDGILQFYRPVGSVAAVVYQDIDYQVYPNTQLRIRLKLGNTSNTKKIVNVHVHDVDHWDGALSCSFEVHPNQPKLMYTMWGTTTGYFSAMRVEISSDSPDSLPYHLIDNVSLQYRPDDTDQGDACIEPTPGRPKIIAPTLAKDVAKSFDIQLQPGKSNYRQGYAPEYHVQIATDETFTAPLWDNDGNYSQATMIPMALEVGNYFIRARQFDGIDRWGKWTKGKPFIVRNFPDIPTLIAPNSEVDGKLLTFKWTDGAETTAYKLVVKDEFKNRIYKGKFSLAEANCDGSTCSLPLSQLMIPLLDNRPHQWFVKAMNDTEKSKSIKVLFTPEMPGMPTLRAPAPGDIVDAGMVFRWDEVPAADQYKLVVKSADRVKVIKAKFTPDEVTCVNGMCEVSLAEIGIPLQDGMTYKWNIRAKRFEPLAKTKTAKWSFTYSASASLESAAQSAAQNTETLEIPALPEFRR